VPKIDAPTVALHRSQRRAALVSAGAELLAIGGVDAVTLAGVGAATGLARSSVYQYFDSAPALLASVVEDVFPRSTEKLRGAVERADSPADKVDAYVVTALDLATDTAHRSLYALSGAGLPEHCRARIAELHEQQFAPLREAVAGLGVADPALSTRLLLGVLQSATQAVVEGTPKARVTREVLAFAHEGLAGPAGRHTPRSR
jgi:AcrR family transcriptional regulator